MRVDCVFSALCVVVVEHFLPLDAVSSPYSPLCFFRLLAIQNCPQEGDYAHFEKR